MAQTNKVGRFRRQAQALKNRGNSTFCTSSLKSIMTNNGILEVAAAVNDRLPKQNRQFVGLKIADISACFKRNSALNDQVLLAW